ncbi:hypothetical protein RKD19_000083 [Streptomyces canus]
MTISDLSADETERLLHTVFSEQPEERGEL